MGGDGRKEACPKEEIFGSSSSNVATDSSLMIRETYKKKNCWSLKKKKKIGEKFTYWNPD